MLGTAVCSTTRIGRAQLSSPARDLRLATGGHYSAARGRSRPPVLTIQRANPLEYADSLKSLFAANEGESFVTFFDAAYSEVVRSGGASWIGLDDEGTVQLNVTLFRHAFEFRGRTVRAGMLANMMASKDYRQFFPSVTLVRRLIRDVSQESELDFLYTDPQPPAAAVMKAARMQHLGDLDRFVIPVSDRRPAHALAARVYAAAICLRAGFSAASCKTIDPVGYDSGPFEVPIGSSSRLRPHHKESMYRRRLRGYPGPAYAWYELRLRGHRMGKEPDAAVLLYGPDEKKIAHVWAIRRPPSIPLAPLMPGLLRAARSRGAHRLQVETLRESDFARELLRIGFQKRNDLLPVVGKAITPVGEDVVNAIHEWEITAIDMER